MDKKTDKKNQGMQAQGRNNQDDHKYAEKRCLPDQHEEGKNNKKDQSQQQGMSMSGQQGHNGQKSQQGKQQSKKDGMSMSGKKGDSQKM